MDALGASTAFSPGDAISSSPRRSRRSSRARGRNGSAHSIFQQKERPPGGGPSFEVLIDYSLHTFVVFIELSASVRVLNAELPMTVVVVVVGFSVTIEQCLVDESRTTQ
jgi:hypothetical protein